MTTTATHTLYQTLAYEVRDHIARVTLNQPDTLNSLTPAFWREIHAVFEAIERDTQVRVVVLASTGKHFTAGLDFAVFARFQPDAAREPARHREQVRDLIRTMQASFNAIDGCRVPVLAAIQGACIGGGVDMIAACDLRYCSRDALFCIQETNLGVTADLGTLQRLPLIIPAGVMRELAYSGRRMPAAEAQAVGLVNAVFDDAATLLAGVLAVAADIATKSPLAIQGTKETLNYARDHSIADGLNFVATWNAGMLITADVDTAIAAQRARTSADFEDIAPRVRLG